MSKKNLVGLSIVAGTLTGVLSYLKFDEKKRHKEFYKSLKVVVSPKDDYSNTTAEIKDELRIYAKPNMAIGIITTALSNLGVENSNISFTNKELFDELVSDKENYTIIFGQRRDIQYRKLNIDFDVSIYFTNFYENFNWFYKELRKEIRKVSKQIL